MTFRENGVLRAMLCIPAKRSNYIQVGGSHERCRARPSDKGEVEFNASNAKSDMYLFNAASPGGGKANSTQPSGSTGNFQAFIGFIAIVVGNVAAIITHSDEISQTASKLLGTEWAYRFYLYIVYGACVLFIIGYGSLTYWLYRRFFAQTGRWIKGGF